MKRRQHSWGQSNSTTNRKGKPSPENILFFFKCQGKVLKYLKQILLKVNCTIIIRSTISLTSAVAYAFNTVRRLPGGVLWCGSGFLCQDNDIISRSSGKPRWAASSTSTAKQQAISNYLLGIQFSPIGPVGTLL